MKTRIIVTTHFVGYDEKNGFVFDMAPLAIPKDSPLYRNGVTEYRSYDSSDLKIKAVAVTINEKASDGTPYINSKKEWIEALVQTFCNDCDKDDEIYLLLHARTDLPPTGYGPYNAYDWIDFNGLSVNIWAFSHERDSNFGVQPLLKTTYVSGPSPELFAIKVKALFLRHSHIVQLRNAWDHYVNSYDKSILEKEVIPQLEMMNAIDGIRKTDILEFRDLEDDCRDEIINSYSKIDILKA